MSGPEHKLTRYTDIIARQLSLWLLYEMGAEPKIDTDVVIKQAASRDFRSLYIPHKGLPD